MDSQIDIAKVADLPVNMTATLSNEIKKHLVELLETEFSAKNTLYDEMRKTEEDKIMDAYRKSVGFDKTIKFIEKVKRELEKAEMELVHLALDEEGNLDKPNRNGYGPKSMKDVQGELAYTRVRAKLNAVAINAPSHQLKAKLIARLWIARTYGEAMVILNEVLGNGVIPQVTKADVKLLVKEVK